MRGSSFGGNKGGEPVVLCSAWGSCALALWAAAVVVWDARTLRLPNALVLPAVPAVWGAAAVCGHA
ncbi:hypothetical protein DLJ54_07530, partial [Corynebacterium heidelbergense]